jgi:hypothetical protein
MEHGDSSLNLESSWSLALLYSRANPVTHKIRGPVKPGRPEEVETNGSSKALSDTFVIETSSHRTSSRSASAADLHVVAMHPLEGCKIKDVLESALLILASPTLECGLTRAMILAKDSLVQTRTHYVGRLFLPIFTPHFPTLSKHHFQSMV